MPVYKHRPGQRVYGFPVGILKLDGGAPYVPGDVSNASTFDFPVMYKVVPGATFKRVREADESLLDAFIESGRELEQSGVRAIAGACGFMGAYQEALAEAMDVPVFLSSLMLVPLMARAMGPGAKVGVVTAHAKGWTHQLRRGSGITDERLIIKGLEDTTAFGNFYAPNGERVLDTDAAEGAVVGAAQEIVEEHPDVRMIVLECAGTPPYSAAVQHATGRTVADYNTLIRMAYDVAVKRPYVGIM
jgi:hypothetical protein